MKKLINKKNPCSKCKILSLDLMVIFLKYQSQKKKDFILPMLNEIKNKFGCITEDDVVCITEYLNISEDTIREAVKNNGELEIQPIKQYLIRVCGGIICQVRGSEKILNAACKELKIFPGDETDDGKFKLVRVSCLGLCEIAPVMAINNVFYGNIDESDVRALLAHEKRKSKN